MNAMDCGEVERQIGRLPYGELSRVEIETLMDHAAACAACRERLMAVRSLEAIIGRNLKRLGGDPTFARRVMERLEREEARRARGTGERTPAPGAETGGTEGGAGVRGWSAADAALVRDRRVLIAVLVAAAVPVVMLALFLPSRGHQEKPRGDAAIRILAATGTVHVLQKTGNGLSAFLPAMAGMSLRPGDRLAGTGAGGGAVRLARAAAGTPDRTAFSVRFRDGAEVAALPDGNIRLAKGEILISVGRLPEGSPPFSVECAGGRAEVRGTEFSIAEDRDGRAVRVAVREGTVALVGASGLTAVVGAGQKGHLEASGKVSGPEPCDVDAALAWALQPPPPKIPPCPDKPLGNPAVPARPPDRPGPDPGDVRWDGGPVTLAEALAALHATRGIGLEIPPSAAEAAGRQLSVCISSPMPLREAVAWMARSCRLSVSWREPDPAAAEGPSRPVAVLSVPADPGKGWEQAPFEPWPDEISREMSVPAPDSLALRAPVADHIRAIGRAAGINVAVDAVDFSRGGEPVSPLETAASPGRVPVVSCGEALRLILEPFGAEAVWAAPMLYVARTGTIERISERDWLFDVGDLTGRQGEGADRKAAALIGLIKFLGPKTSGGEPVCTDRAAVAGGFLRIRTSRSGRDAVRSILRSIRTAGERPDVPDLSVVLTGDIRPRRVSGIGVLATEAAGRTGLRIRLGCPDVEFPPQALYFREAGIGDALQWACDISGMQVVADGEDLVIRPASDPRGAGSLWAVPLRDPAAAKGRAAIQDLTGALRERLLLHRPFLMRGAFLAPFLDCLVVAGTGRQASVAFEEAAAMKDAMARGLPPLHNDRRAALDRALALRPAAAPERLQGRFRDLLRGIIGPQTSATILVEPSAMRRVAETVVELDTKDKTCGRIVGELAAAAGLEMLIENGVVLLAEPEKR